MSQATVKSERVPRTSAPILDVQIEKLKSLFPEAVSEGKVDFDKLRATLGDEVHTGRERFSFTWAGKQDCISLLQTPSRATLVPCPEESVNFGETENIFIEGDYQPTSNPETNGRYHSDWLSMMYPRLFRARQLLRVDGVIFISCDDHEMHHLRLVMNEIFGEENFVECFVWKKSYGGGAKEKYAVSQHEYVLLYARELASLPELWLPPDPEVERKYYKYQDDKHETRGPYRLQPLEAGKSMDHRQNLIFPIPLPSGGELMPKRQWLWNRERVQRAIENDELVFNTKGEEVTVSYKQYLLDPSGERRGAKPASVIDRIFTQHGTQELLKVFDGELVMQFPKPRKLMKLLLNCGMNTGDGDIVMDFFAGSCTTAQALLELNRQDGGNRQFLMIQLPEPTPLDSPARKLGLDTIADIGKERIRRFSTHVETEGDGELDFKPAEKEDLGFKVFKLAASNYQPWTGVAERDPDAYVEAMELFTDPLVDGWHAINVIWEVAIKEGFGLNARIEKVAPGVPGAPGADAARLDNTVYHVTDPDKEQSFRICLDEELHVDIARAVELSAGDLFVCRDKALDDTAAANLALQCRLKTI